VPDGYELHDGRYTQVLNSTSAADALNVFLGPVPANKVWTILAARYLPNVSETRTVWWSKWNSLIGAFPLTIPASRLLNTVIPNPLVIEGEELKLYPGEYLAAYRDVATAGSTMGIGIQFVETDLPYYSQVEPQRKLTQRRSDRIYQAVTGGAGRTGGSGPGGGRGGGRGGAPEPI